MTCLHYAAIASVFTALVHLVAGGREVARPLLASALPEDVKYVAYFCWHITTLALLAMAAGFWWAGEHPQELGLKVGLTGFAAACAFLNLTLIIGAKQSPVRMPQWILFLLIAGLGLNGLAPLA